MILAEFTIGNALVTTLSIFFFVIWIWILIVILTDVFGDHDLSGWGKAACMPACAPGPGSRPARARSAPRSARRPPRRRGPGGRVR